MWSGLKALEHGRWNSHRIMDKQLRASCWIQPGSWVQSSCLSSARTKIEQSISVDWRKRVEKISTACLRLQGYFMPQRYGVMFIVNLYLHFWCSFFFRDLLFSYSISIILTYMNNLYRVVWLQVFLFNTNNHMVSSNYFYLIIVTCSHK